MTDGNNAILCPDEEMTSVLRTLETNDEAGLRELDRMLARYPNDARLHFLSGSVLAGVQRYDEGRGAMARAIEIAPDFMLARFQLGFLELTSGMPEAAVATWKPLGQLPAGSAFRLLSEGLVGLANDDFQECDRLLRLGMAANDEHPLINGDMQLILDEIADKLTAAPTHEASEMDAASATHQLLQQFELKGGSNKTRH